MDGDAVDAPSAEQLGDIDAGRGIVHDLDLGCHASALEGRQGAQQRLLERLVRPVGRNHDRPLGQGRRHGRAPWFASRLHAAIGLADQALGTSTIPISEK